MTEVLLPSTPEFLRRYPHQLSGGQQQRVGLAMAFACRPSVIVLDEPTTGLDVSTQAHVLATVRDLCRTHGVAALYVTHDLAVVANLADRVAVMYAGRVVEQGPTDELFARAAHPYTRHLIAAVPDITGDREVVGLPGRAPSPGQRPVGCTFAERCEAATDECRASVPRAVDRRRSTTRSAASTCARPSDTARGTGDQPPARAGAGGGRTDAAGRLRRVRDVTVVHDVDLQIAPGECLAIVGESGVGQDHGLPLDRWPAPRVDGRDPARRRRRWPTRPAIDRSSNGCGSSTCSRTRTAR